MTNRRTFLGLTCASTAAAVGMTPVRSWAEADPGTARARIERVPDLFVKDWGDGRSVVLCHGWPVHADSWDYHACALAEAGYRVISIDRRGFGRSSQPSGGYDYDSFADDLASEIASHGLRRWIGPAHEQLGEQLQIHEARSDRQRILRCVQHEVV